MSEFESRFESPNLGAIGSIELIRSDRCIVGTIADTGYRVNIGVYNTNEIIGVVFTYESAEFEQSGKQVSEGYLFEQDLKYFIPKSRREVNKEIAEMIRYNWVIVVTDVNGVSVIMGTTENPARFNVKQSVPAKFKELNGYLFRFSSKSGQPVYSLDEFLIIDPGGPSGE